MRKTLFDKKSILRILIAAITVIFAALFLGCEENVTSLVAKYDSITIKPEQTIDVASVLEKSGDGKIYYSVENPDVLELNGSKLTGLKEGEGAVVAIAGDFTVRIAVTVSTGNKVNLVFADTTAVYDGSAFFISPTGILPQGSSIKYTCNGEEFTGAVDVGSYEITAEVALPEGYVLVCDDFTAVLTIEKAHYDMSAVSFPTRVFRYDGKEHVVTVSGTIPEGVNVTYKNNSAKEVGSYVATAIFEGNDPNYEDIGSVSCKFTIEPSPVFLSDYGIEAIEKVYDGEKTNISSSGLPDGARLEFYEKNGETYVKSTTAPQYTDVGTYVYYVRVIANDYAAKNYAFYTETEQVSFSSSSDGEKTSPYLRVPVTVKKANLNVGSLVIRDKDGNSLTEFAYGTKLTIGEPSDESVAVKLENGNLNGVKNEFIGKYTVKYEIKAEDNTVSLDDCDGVLPVRVYSVTATAEFSPLADEFDKNYNVPSSPNITFAVKRAKYDVSGLKFKQTETTGTYDGTETEFCLDNEDENLNVKYTIGGEETNKVLHAGKYEIRAELTFKDETYLDNYEKIPDIVKSFEVFPAKIRLDGVSFKGVDKTYDGKGITPEITLESGKTLPDNVNVKYCFADGIELTEPIVNAGKYQIYAIFSYDDEISRKGDFLFTVGEKDVTSLAATFTINKANYTEEDLKKVTVETEEDKTYFYGMKLDSFTFLGENKDTLRWLYPGLEIGNLTPLYDENKKITGWVFIAETVYNADKNNYNDYVFKTAIPVKPRELDLEGTSVPDQFVAATGSTLGTIKVVFGKTEYTKELRTEVKFSADNTATVTLVPEKENNYKINGNAEFENVKIYKYNPFEFTYKEGTTTLNNYIGNAAVVDIPTGTTKITSSVFGEKAEYIERLVIPDTVVEVSKSAFYGTTNLREITLDSLKTQNIETITDLFGSGKPQELKVTVISDAEIGYRAFYGAEYITEVEYKTKLTSIGKEAFSGCTSLVSIGKDTSGITSIGESAFRNCAQLKSLVLPSLIGNEGQAVALSYYFGSTSGINLETVALVSNDDFSLAENAFFGASKMTKLTLGKGLASIGKTAFSGVSASLDLSKTKITEIGEYAFFNYLGKEIVLPQGITKIGYFAFAKTVCLFAESGQKLVIPKSVKEISSRAFSESCINEIEFERNSVYTEVASEAFYEFYGKKITLTDAVTALGTRAFANTKCESIVIGKGVTEIGVGCFENSASLTSFVIPSGVAYIRNNAFYNCSLLTKITFEGTAPPTNYGPTVFATNGAVITFYIKVGANETAFKTYFDNCGASGTYNIVNIS